MFCGARAPGRGGKVMFVARKSAERAPGFTFSFALQNVGLRLEAGCGSSGGEEVLRVLQVGGRGELGQKGFSSCQPLDLIVCPVWQRRELLIGFVILKVTDQSLGTTSVRPGSEFCLQNK